jgi:hypothetical protein
MFANCVDKKAAKISEIKMSVLAYGKKSYQDYAVCRFYTSIILTFLYIFYIF